MKILILIIGIILSSNATYGIAMDANTNSLNVVLIVCDDLNDYVGPFGGHPQVKTPHMNSLAETGVWFSQAHCNIPICNPSRASFMTGIYPHTSQCFGFENWDEVEVLKHSRTMMDHFRNHGYHVLGTGKLMHNRDEKEWSEYGYASDYGPFAYNGKKTVAHPDVPSPFRDEFGAIDGSYGPLMNLNGRICPQTGNPFTWRTGNWSKQRKFKYLSETNRDRTGDELNGDWAVERLKSFASDNIKKPFFLGVGFLRPHTPLIVPRKYFDMYPLDKIRLPEILENDIKDTFKHTVTSKADDRSSDRGAKIYDLLVEAYNGKSELALKKFIQAYLASVTSVDDQIGRILNEINNSSLRDNTIVLLTSDHGWGNGEKEYVYKNSLWQESTRVPLVIRAPGMSMEGHEVDIPVSLIDIYPTLIDLCGLSNQTMKNEKGRPLDGFSLCSLLKDPKLKEWKGPKAALTALYKWSDYYDPREQSYALRYKNWRYIKYQNGNEELYHTKVDPHEWHNLALNDEYSGQLEVFRKDLDARLPPAKPRPIPKKQPAEAWKDAYFKKFPSADSNGDGVLTWPEYKKHRGE